MLAATWLAALMLSGATFEQLSKQAAEARDQNRLEEAARLYRQALRLKPGWSEGWWFLGTLMYDRDRYPECADAFSRLIALKPDMGPGEALLGLCEFNLKRYPRALGHLFHAAKSGFGPDPQLRQVAIYHTALALIVVQDYERALEQLTLLVRTTEANDKVRLAAGIAALRQPWLPDQVPAADRDLVARLGEAKVAELERRTGDAGHLYEVVVAAYPKAPGLHYAYGSFLLSGDANKALVVLKQELAITPNHVPALAAIAGEYLKRDDPAAARDYAAKAARAAPEDFAARTTYGRALLETGDVPGAIRELEAAVKLAPGSPHARFALADAYTRAGRKADAERERKEFARLRNLIDSEKK
jgi:tetratricopeptide (TPR) repeat protein